MPPSDDPPSWRGRPVPSGPLGASVGIGDDNTPDSSAVGRPPGPAAPVPLVPAPPASGSRAAIEDVSERLDAAEWIGHVHAEFGFETGVGPRRAGRPGGGLHLALFRFEARVGDRVRFLVTPRDQGVTADPAPVPRFWLRVYDARGTRPAGEQLGNAKALRDGQGLVGCKLKSTFNRTGPYHLGVWWHPDDCPAPPAGDPYHLWVEYEGLDLPDLVATAAHWDDPAGGLRLEYEVTEPHPVPGRVRPADWGPGVVLFWVDQGCRRLGRVRAEAVDRHNAGTRIVAGARSLLVPPGAFERPPVEATGVEFSLNADRLTPELDPLNNTRFVSLPGGGRTRLPDPPAE